jgi:beta-ring hydroxylase
MWRMQIFRLSFGPKSFVIISDPAYVRQILMTNADKYSKGLLSEILVRHLSKPNAMF